MLEPEYTSVPAEHRFIFLLEQLKWKEEIKLFFSLLMYANSYSHYEYSC